jgi:hypothetical protein
MNRINEKHCSNLLVHLVVIRFLQKRYKHTLMLALWLEDEGMDP